MDREQFVKVLLEKRFGEKDPDKILCLLEINTFIPADNETSMGIGIQLIMSDNRNNTIIKEEYQVNEKGVIFSWGKTPVIDEKSLKQKL